MMNLNCQMVVILCQISKIISNTEADSERVREGCVRSYILQSQFFSMTFSLTNH